MKILILFSFLIIASILSSGCDTATDSKATSVTRPILVNPPDNMDSVSVTPLFTWTNGANKIEIDLNSAFSSPSYSNDALNMATQLQYPGTPALTPGTDYYWRVGVLSGSTYYWCDRSFHFKTKP